MPPDALVYCSSNCEDEPRGRMSSAYESDIVRVVNSSTEAGGESEMALVARAWSRSASDQRVGVLIGRTLGWPSVGHERVRKERDGHTCDMWDQTSVLRSPHK